MSLFLSLPPLEGVRHLALEQWNEALRQLGHEVEEAPLRRRHVPPEATAAEIAAWIARRKPAALFTASALSFTVPEFFHRPEVRAVPAAAFWFDDPYRPVNRWETRPGFLDALRLPSVHHFVWDGHWRDWLRERHGVASHPIHLAADPAAFHPLPAPPESAGEAVFVGTLVSAAHLAAQRAQLPPLLEKVARQAEAAIAGGPDGANPFAFLERIVAALPGRLGEETAALRARDPDAWLLLEGLTWKWGKNEVRRRMLRAAVRVAPVAVLSGNLEQTQAGEAEVAALAAGAPHSLRFVDTGALDGSRLASLYARGAVHLQATDPQSVAGGIPFRVFQTTACAKPLLTDVKPELLDCYREKEEIACYRSGEELASRLASLLADTGERDRLAQAGRARFLAQHTWHHRVAEVFKTLGLS